MTGDSLSARLRATFLTEVEEQVGTMNADLLALEAAPADADRLRSLFRSAHTLKGAARAAGVPLIEEVFHALEELLDRARRELATLGPGEFVLLFAAVDALADAGARMRAGNPLEGSLLAALREDLRVRRPPAPGRPRPPRPPSPADGVRPGDMPAAAPDRETESAPAAAEGAERGHVRVEAEQLDALVSVAGELRTASRRVQARSPELRELSHQASRDQRAWHRALRRVRGALESAGAPPSLVAEVDAVDAGVRTLVQGAARMAAAAEADARALAGVTDAVADGVRRLRMRPFADACEGLPRLVRDVAATAGKEVRIELSGQEVEADREVWAAVREALLHLVRNAVDHGIEPPRARVAAGKPRQGTVSVGAAPGGGRIVVTVADDGAGVDVPALRDALVRQGHPVPEAESELARRLFAGGVSTRKGATLVSGRGVGMDAVRAAVARIRGRVDLAWTEGKGTTCTVTCPPSVTTLRALLVRAGSQLFAIPSADVERLVRGVADAVRSVDGREALRTEDAPVPIVGLAGILGPPLEPGAPSGPPPLLLLRVGARRLAVAVDEVLDEQELVVQPLRRVRTPPPYLSGAALLSTGRVALVLGTSALLDLGLSAPPGPGLGLRTEEDAPRRPRIVVADDSITTRTLEESILDAAGFEVRTAADGAAAWQLLQEWECDLVVSDVEMPRMDGFALCEAIRASSRLAELPVVLVTALETAEHRARGLEAGADAYLPKSSFDQEQLLETIRQLVGEP